jgi:hypothetical protein
MCQVGSDHPLFSECRHNIVHSIIVDDILVHVHVSDTVCETSMFNYLFLPTVNLLAVSNYQYTSRRRSGRGQMISDKCGTAVDIIDTVSYLNIRHEYPAI